MSAILSKDRQLKKELSLLNVYTIATGATLSSGFFLLPGIAANEAGAAIVIAYLLAVVPFIPGILSKTELATAMPRAGGTYYFIDRSLGPLMGTIGGLGTWCALILKSSFALVGIGAYLHLFLPNAPIAPVAIGFAAFFGIVNLFGAHRTGVFQTLLVIGLLVLLAWFIGNGIPHVNTAHFANLTANGWDHIWVAAGMVCISYMGVTKVASVAEEIDNPERNLPLGIVLALVTAVIVYGLGTYVMVGVLGNDLKGSITPVSDAAENMFGSTGAKIMAVAALLAFFSVANAGILSASRYPLAMGRDHLMSRWFSQLTAHKSPHNAIYATVVMIVVCLLLFDLTKIAKLASAFQLLLFALNCLAVIVMRESQIESYDPGFKSPWYPWMQIVGIIAPLAMITIMGWLPIAFTVGLIIVSVWWYQVYGRPRVNRGGAIFHLFARLGQRRFEGLDRELRSILKEKGLRTDDPYDEVVAAAAVIDEPGVVDFEHLVHAASQRLAAQLPLSADQLATSFLEGTRVGATPVSHGAALPHLRLPNLEKPLMVLARATKGVTIDVQVDFIDHSQDQLVHAIIFLVSPEEDASQHLRILAQVAGRIDDEQFITDWLAAPDEQAIKQILLRDERFVTILLDPRTETIDLIDRPVREIDLPEGSLIAMVHRGGRMLVPRGATQLNSGDSITIIGEPAAIAQLRTRYDPTAT